MNDEFEYVGGHIWSLIEKDENGYDKTIISVEIDNGKIFIFEKTRSLTESEFDKLSELIKKVLI